MFPDIVHHSVGYVLTYIFMNPICNFCQEICLSYCPQELKISGQNSNVRAEYSSERNCSGSSTLWRGLYFFIICKSYKVVCDGNYLHLVIQWISTRLLIVMKLCHKWGTASNPPHTYKVNAHYFTLASNYGMKLFQTNLINQVTHVNWKQKRKVIFSLAGPVCMPYRNSMSYKHVFYLYHIFSNR